MIKLTVVIRHFPDELHEFDVYFNPAHIVSFGKGEKGEGRLTKVLLTNGDLNIKESPEEILEKIREASRPPMLADFIDPNFLNRAEEAK